MAPESKIFRVPVKTVSSAKPAEPQLLEEDLPPAAEVKPATVAESAAVASEASATVEPVRDYVREAPSGAVDWQSVALQLQADAQAYRQRQALRDAQRLAEERERLLLPFFDVMDNLERTLAAAEESALPAERPLYQGLALTYRSMCHLLEREGITPIATVGAPFDPHVHEAVAVVPGTAEQGAESVVVEEVRRGYRQGERVLRPARVVVAHPVA